MIRLGGVARLISSGRFEQPAPFELELEDGHRVRVEPTADVVVEPVAFDEGARVELLVSDDVEYAFEEASGHREAPAKKLVRVTARAVASGEHASDVIERVARDLASGDAARPATRPKKDKRRDASLFPQATKLLAGTALTSIVIAVALGLSPLAVDLATFALSTLAAAAGLCAVANRPRFVHGQATVDAFNRVNDGTNIEVAAWTLVFAWPFSFYEDAKGYWHDARPGEAAVNVSMLGIGAAACFIVVVLVELRRRQLREEHRLLRMLLDAPELPDTGGLRETWGSVEGVVRDPTPVTAEGEASAVVHVVDETAKLGDSDPAKVVQRVLSAGTFFVDTIPGAKYEVDPKDARWTSTVRRRALVSLESEKFHARYHQVVPISGSILVAARAVRFKKATTGKLASTGPESLLFFATEPGDSARRAARFLVRARSMSLAVILLCAAGVVALGALAERRLPAFSFGTDRSSD